MAALRSKSVLLLSIALVAAAGCSAITNSTTTSATTTTGSTSVANAYPDPTGTISTYAPGGGTIPTTGAFFQTLGSNQRTCQTCHQPSQAMSLSAASIQALFASTNGTDPLFTAIDGANYPTAPTGNAAAHSLILNNGLIRIPVELPAGTQFTITAISDPYGTAIALDPVTVTGRQIISTYRRPLPSASLPYLSNVMWDTRETLSPLSSASTFSAALTADLNQQALDAITNHEQGTAAPTTAQLNQILAFEQGLFTAQSVDTAAGPLTTNASGGAANLAAENFYPGINDAFGGDPTGTPFNPAVFTLYTKWQGPNTTAAQNSINRGEGLFNNAPMQITDVPGINDNTSLNSPPNVKGSCATCHDTPNIGAHSLPLPLDTGTPRLAADETDPNILAGLAQLSLPSLPVFQITGCKDASNHPVTYTTTDPGKAVFTGQCADVNRVKVPILRGLAARAPYFHNGSAANLTQLVNFYNARFQMKLDAGQISDLVNFLNAL